MKIVINIAENELTDDEIKECIDIVESNFSDVEIIHESNIKQNIEAYSFPEVFGEPIEMLIDGIWVKGKVINDYRSRDGIVNMETADGKKYWCGCERTDCYRQPKEGENE